MLLKYLFIDILAATSASQPSNGHHRLWVAPPRGVVLFVRSLGPRVVPGLDVDRNEHHVQRARHHVHHCRRQEHYSPRTQGLLE